jgi:hypothetical protein
MASAIYRACFAAIQKKHKIIFTVEGRQREAYPHVLGWSDGREKLFVYQTAGYSKGGRLPGWRCFHVAEIQLLTAAEGSWRTGDRHTQRQSCVKDVDIDVNPKAKQHYRWPED